MKNKTIILLLLALTALSCQKAFLADDKESAGISYTLYVSGTVSDLETSSPLESIRLTFDAYTTNRTRLPEYSKVIYTDNQGRYQLTMPGLHTPVKYTVTADDLKNHFSSHSGEISIDMNGPSFIDGAFYVNDFNIWLKKAE